MCPEFYSTASSDVDKTREQLLSELQELRSRVAILREAEVKTENIAEALRDSEIRFQSLIQNSSDVIRILDRNGLIIFDSMSSQKVFGYPPGYTLGKSPFDFIHPDDVDRVRTELGEVYYNRNSGKPTEFRVRKADGEYLDVEAVGVNMIGVQGVDGIVITTRDITERKRAEEELRKLSRAVEGSPTIVVITDLKGDIEFANPKFTEITGYTLAEAKGKNPHILKSGYTSPEEYKRLWDTILSGKEWRGEFKNKKKNGDFYWESAVIAPVKDAEGRITNFIAIKEDITELKKARDGIKEESQRLFSLLEGLPAFVYLQARDHSIRFVNQNFRKIFGDPQNRPCYEVIQCRDKPCQDCPTFKVFDTLQPQQWEWTNKTGNTYQIYDYPFRDIDGTPLVLEMGIDITERKRTENEQEITVEFLRLVNEVQSTGELIRSTAAFFQQRSGCEAVGIRLREGDDYPYYEARGFRPEFIRKENLICTSRDGKGRVLHDKDGFPMLDCMCGNVITGRFDPSKPFFTPRGSFWTNSTTELLATTTENDRLAKTRNVCNTEGYESFALIALRVGEERLGVLQLNDRRKGHFTLEQITMWERLADYLAVALAKFQAEEALLDAKSQAELYLDLMGHDINNMNQVGMGFLELALDTLNLDENGQSLLSKPMSAFENSTKLIDNVRKLQKVKSGELCNTEMDIGQVLKDVQFHYSHLHGGNVSINYVPVIGYVVRANALLYDVFSNLVSNAIKHSNGHPIINIKVEQARENNHDYYKVFIEDNGPGVPDDLKPMIFNRRLKGGQKAKGSGIGLFLVKTLVDDYGGRVWVEDRVPGNHTRGSKFVVLLPRVET
jgi:PAS domain S-box-containing protein